MVDVYRSPSVPIIIIAIIVAIIIITIIILVQGSKIGFFDFLPKGQQSRSDRPSPPSLSTIYIALSL